MCFKKQTGHTDVDPAHTHPNRATKDSGLRLRYEKTPFWLYSNRADDRSGDHWDIGGYSDTAKKFIQKKALENGLSW